MKIQDKHGVHRWWRWVDQTVECIDNIRSSNNNLSLRHFYLRKMKKDGLWINFAPSRRWLLLLLLLFLLLLLLLTPHNAVLSNRRHPVHAVSLLVIRQRQTNVTVYMRSPTRRDTDPQYNHKWSKGSRLITLPCGMRNIGLQKRNKRRNKNWRNETSETTTKRTSRANTRISSMIHNAVVQWVLALKATGLDGLLCLLYTIVGGACETSHRGVMICIFMGQLFRWEISMRVRFPSGTCLGERCKKYLKKRGANILLKKQVAYLFVPVPKLWLSWRECTENEYTTHIVHSFPRSNEKQTRIMIFLDEVVKWHLIS